jgi:hypothetical protein
VGDWVSSKSREIALEVSILETKKEIENNIKTNLRDVGFEDWRWFELAEDRVQWLALLLAVVVILGVLLPELVWLSKRLLKPCSSKFMA